MQHTDIPPETLNAYVDGELERAEEAGVARAAAQNPAIAAQIATLRELKAAIPETVPDRDISLPASVGQPRGRIAAAVAASIVLFVAAAILQMFIMAEPEGTKWAHFLQTRHNGWSFSHGGRDTDILRASGPAGLLPLDLKSARLTFTGHEEISFSGHKVLRTGYEGTRGCRVSLFVFPGGIVPDESRFGASLLVRRWEIQNQGFLLMADGMARTRFEGLAQAVEKALRAGSQPDARARQQLAYARKTSPPCQA